MTPDPVTRREGLLIAAIILLISVLFIGAGIDWNFPQQATIGGSTNSTAYLYQDIGSSAVTGSIMWRTFDGVDMNKDYEIRVTDATCCTDNSTMTFYAYDGATETATSWLQHSQNGNSLSFQASNSAFNGSATFNDDVTIAAGASASAFIVEESGGTGFGLTVDTSNDFVQVRDYLQVWKTTADTGFEIYVVDGNTSANDCPTGTIGDECTDTDGDGSTSCNGSECTKFVHDGSGWVGVFPATGRCHAWKSVAFDPTENATMYVSLFDAAQSATQTDVDDTTVPDDLSGLELDVTVDVAPGGADTWAVTLVDDGGDTALTCTVADPATSCEDTSNLVNIADSSKLSIKVVGSATVAAAAEMIVSFCTEPR